MRRRHAGFSLIEVVIAIGVTAGGIAVILALLPSLARESANAADLQTALRLPDAVEIRLREEMGGAFPGGLQSGVVLIADKDGANVRRETQTGTPPTLPYFHIEAKPFPGGDLAYQSGRPVLPLTVRVAWPYAAVKAAEASATVGNFQSVNFIVTLTP